MSRADAKTLLIVYHSQSGRTEKLCDAVVRGAEREESVDVVVKRALEANTVDLLAANLVVFGTPENFGYMSGALKNFFDRTYDEAKDYTPPQTLGHVCLSRQRRHKRCSRSHPHRAWLRPQTGR